MLTPRGIGLAAGGLALWAGSRMLGGPDLHLVAVGLLGLPALAMLTMARRAPDVRVTRKLSTSRVFPGGRLRVDVELRGRGMRGAILAEDRLPTTMARGARALLSGEGDARRMSYTLACRTRGRYRLGPLLVFQADPFDLVRRRREIPGTHEIVVYPEVEDLRAARAAAPGIGAGEASTRRVFRTGDEFYTIRSYEIGDDLRRIHWPSTARMGKLMIRQDEATRRSSATILLDNRVASLGGRRIVFEKAVSAAASIGVHLARSGFSLQLATTDTAPRPMERAELLETLAVAGTTRTDSLLPALRRLSQPGPGADLVIVTHLPPPEEAAALARLRGYRRTALLIGDRSAEGGRARTESATAILGAAGWDVVLLAPTGGLREVWRASANAPRTAARS